MKLAILGATGRTGQHVVREALAAGHRVRVLARRPYSQAGVEVVQGDALNGAAVRALVSGTDAIVSVLGPIEEEPSQNVCSRATHLLVDAAKAAGVKRIVVVSGALIGHPRLGRFYRFMASRRAVASTLADRREQERLVQTSGLDWTLVRPPRLRDRRGPGSVVVGADASVGMMASVARADLARVLVRAATSADWQGQGVTVLQTFGARAFGAWVWRMGFAELLGIAFAAATAVGFLTLFGEPRSLPMALAFLACMLVAGAVEGALLGFLPGSMLARSFPGLSLWRFGGLTTAVAVAAWFLGMIPSTLTTGSAAPAAEPSLALVMAPSAGAGAVAGALMGTAQWFALKRVVPRAWRWIAASALGWALALPLDMLAGMLPQPDDPLARTIAVSAVLGLAAGVLVAVPTGLLLLRMLRERDDVAAIDRAAAPVAILSLERLRALPA